MTKQILAPILTVLFTFSFVQSYAQNFGVKAGYNLSTINYNLGMQEDLSLLKQPGFHLGLNLSTDISKNLSLETLLSLSVKGFRLKYIGENESLITETNTSLFFLDLPIGLKYKIPVGEFNVFALGGGYIGSAVHGKSKSKIISNSLNIPEETTTAIVFNSKEKPSTVTRLDYGLMYGGGIEYKLFSISAQHLIGMNDYFNNATSQHRIFQVSLGYTFQHQVY